MSFVSAHSDCLPSETSLLADADSSSRCALTPPRDLTCHTYVAALSLFQHTLEQQERPRPDIHGVMLQLADRSLIEQISESIRAAWQAGERVWLTADLHLGHQRLIDYCRRPFSDAASMDDALVRQLRKVGADEWLIFVGDLAMGNHLLSLPLLRQILGRKVLVLGNHDITRAGICHYVSATDEAGAPLFEAVVPFLFWAGHGGQEVMVTHYPVQMPAPVTPSAADDSARALPLLNYHGHLHRDVLPHSPRVQYVNVGWDVTQGLVCL